MKNQKGITLVALVITIIVLLILAGVSISLVVGQNGVLGKATGSVKAQKASAAKEAISLAISAVEADYYSAWSGNQATTRASYYIIKNLKTELSSAGYTIVAPAEETTSFIGSEVTLNVTKGSDDVKVTFTINATTAQISWGAVQIKDNGAYVDVPNV